MKKTISDLIQIVTEADTKREKLVQDSLPYSRSDLEPVMSKDTLDYHYGTLAKSYVDRYNKGEGDDDFNRAGAYLHNVLFAQFTAPSGSNRPFGPSIEFINKYFDNYEKFREEFSTEAMKIQGSGWIYLSKRGEIKTIKNHEIRNDIVLLIDWWEHAFQFDYLADKQKYLKNIWRIINWTVINDRLRF